MTAQVRVSFTQMAHCLGHFGWRFSIWFCRRHISHKEKSSTYILPGDWSWNFSVVWLPCNTKSVPVIMFSRAEQMISMQEAVDSTFQLCFSLGKSSLTPPYPTVAPDFLYFVGKNNMLVYFSALIRQWSSLCPAGPLLRDKGTSKASVFVVGALQEDKVTDLMSGSGFKVTYMPKIVCFVKLSRFFSSLFVSAGT